MMWQRINSAVCSISFTNSLVVNIAYFITILSSLFSEKWLKLCFIELDDSKQLIEL